MSDLRLELRLFDAVTYKDPVTSRGRRTLLGMVDEFFYLGCKEVEFCGRKITLGNKKALVTNEELNEITFIEPNPSPSWASVALKITLYCTVIIPLLMLPLKAI